jgi:nucleoside 2-deoxyribosyltransferase
MPKSIYLANQYGFSEQENQNVLPLFVDKLDELGLNVLEPFHRNNQVGFETKAGQGHMIAIADKNDVISCDGIFAIVNGLPPDEGVMVELGIAIALSKPTFIFRDDFRKCCDSYEYPLNLMIFSGLPKYNWEDFYYTDLEDLHNPDKALSKWARGDLQWEKSFLI